MFLYKYHSIFDSRGWFVKHCKSHTQMDICLTLPMGIMNNPGTCSGHPGTIPKTSQGSPKALLVLKKLPRTSDELAVTKQQWPASNHKPPETSYLATFQDPRKGSGGRRPKALKYKILTYWLTHWLAYWLTHWLAYWLTDSLTGLLFDRQDAFLLTKTGPAGRVFVNKNASCRSKSKPVSESVSQ